MRSEPVESEPVESEPVESEPVEAHADLAVVRDEDASNGPRSGPSSGPSNRPSNGVGPRNDTTPDDVPAVAVARPARWRISRWVSEVPLALVIIGVGIGLVTIALHHFRWGSLAISVSVLAAGVFRLVLPARQAGLLVVRGRFTDVLTMGLIGGALFVLAAVTST